MRRVPFVVGVDFASQPLLQVKKARLQAVQGDACALPFPDKAFDAVVAGELIEHLNESAWPRVLIEIKRVSRRFVLLTVPFREVLEFDQVKCGYCYHIFNASRHKRSLVKSLMSSLLHPEFGVTLMQTFGPSLKRTPRQLVRMAQLFDGYMKGNSGGCMCPQCGNTESFIQNDWARLIFLKIPSRLLPLPKFPIWMAALYEKRQIG
jgi:hypothetical protein